MVECILVIASVMTFMIFSEIYKLLKRWTVGFVNNGKMLLTQSTTVTESLVSMQNIMRQQMEENERRMNPDQDDDEEEK